MTITTTERAGVCATYSVGFGIIGAATSFGYRLLARWMETLPFGVNDFDLILFAVMIGGFGLLAVAFACDLFGLIFGLVGIFRDPRPPIAAVGTLLAATALAILFVSA